MTDKRDITACIKTFCRPTKFEKTLQSVIDAGIKKINVGYDGPADLLQLHYDIIKKHDATINFRVFPFNKGLAYVRNALVSEAKTKYILLLDDDHYIPKCITDALFLFEGNLKLGVLSFPWKITSDAPPDYYKEVIDFQQSNRVLEASNLKISKEVLGYLIPLKQKYLVINKLLFVYPFDYVPNSAFFKREVFDSVKWDSKFKIGGEHQDFFYRLKKTDFECAVCLNIFIEHNLGSDPIHYFPFDLFRFGKMEQRSNAEILNKKLGIKDSAFTYKGIQFFYYNRDRITIDEKAKKMIIDNIEVGIKD